MPVITIRSSNEIPSYYFPSFCSRDGYKAKAGDWQIDSKRERKGIVSIIDSRVGKKSKAPYKQIIWDSLPIKSKTNKIEEIAAFYNQVVEQQKEGK